MARDKRIQREQIWDPNNFPPRRSTHQSVIIIVSHTSFLALIWLKKCKNSDNCIGKRHKLTKHDRSSGKSRANLFTSSRGTVHYNEINMRATLTWMWVMTDKEVVSHLNDTSPELREISLFLLNSSEEQYIWFVCPLVSELTNIYWWILFSIAAAFHTALQ